MSLDARLPVPLRALLGPETPESRRVVGPFHLLRQLGRGGFAPVWLAEERYGGQSLRWAAVKLFSLGTGTTALGQGILEEARRLCQVEHPNVVRFYALPVDEARGVAGLAMEFIDGPSLDRALTERGSLDVDEALQAGIAVASALAAVHQAGLVHRDVKPANVIKAGGVYKLIDFGIAAAGGEARGGGVRCVVVDDLPLELTGSRMSELPRGTVRVAGDSGGEPWLAGTVGYIDPCTLRDGAAATASSDLYGLGALLFEALTGQLPAAVGGTGGLRGPVLSGMEAPESLGSTRPGLPTALVRLVDALLAPSREGRPPSAERVLAELERIQRERRGRASAPPEEGPFRGLARYEDRDRDVYFGRSHEIAASLDRLRTRGLLALVGLSGTGKSSLARAGLLPAVADGALGGWPRRWSCVATSPGDDPARSIGAALQRVAPGVEAMTPERAVEAVLEQVQRREEGVLLLLDQLEELATQSSEPGRRWAAEFLRRACDPPVPGLRVVVTLRQDLLASLLEPALELGALRDVLLRGTVFVLPLTDASWGEVLDESLERYGYHLDPPALRDELLAGLRGAASAMPLVQFALAKLWERRDVARRCIPREALRSLGGIGGALEQHAEGVIEALRQRDPELVAVAREVLLALTTPQGTRATRREADLRRLAPEGQVQAVLAELRAARLVSDEEGGVTLAHETLLTQWQRLRAWVDESRSERQEIEALEQAAAAWRRAGEDDTLLLRKVRLAQAESVVARTRLRLSLETLSFVAHSRTAARRGNLLVGSVAGAVTALFVGLGAMYLLEAERKNQQIAAQNIQIEQALRVAEGRQREAETNQALAEENARQTEAARRRADELGDAFRRQLSSLEERIDRASAAQLARIRQEVKAKRGTLGAPTPLPPASTWRPGLEGEPPP